jgi:mRNA interferase RelE/StbE
MRYALEFTSSALREFRALEKQARRRIAGKITQLSDNPFPHGSKKLECKPDHIRIRVGDYRVIDRVDGRGVVVVIMRVAHRREVYNKLENLI